MSPRCHSFLLNSQRSYLHSACWHSRRGSLICYFPFVQLSFICFDPSDQKVWTLTAWGCFSDSMSFFILITALSSFPAPVSSAFPLLLKWPVAFLRLTLLKSEKIWSFWCLGPRSHFFFFFWIFGRFVILTTRP